MTDIQLSDEDRAFIEGRLRAGEYRTAADVVSAGLQSLRQDEEELRRLIQEGEDDIKAGRFHTFGENDDLTAFILERARARVKARQE